MTSTTVNVSALLMCLVFLTPDAIAKPWPTMEYSKHAGSTRTPSNIRTPRKEYVSLLCRLALKFTTEAVVFGQNFKTRRIIQIENRTPHPDIFKVMENRRRDIIECCQNESVGSKLRCLTDRRRWRIDYLCSEEPPLPIPFTDANRVAMEDRIEQCCYKLGDPRYRCFNLTSDQIAVSPGIGCSVDESDPLNDIWDYPVNISDIDKVVGPRTTNATRFQKRRDLNQNNEKSEKVVVKGNQTCTCADLAAAHEHIGRTSLPRTPTGKSGTSRKSRNSRKTPTNPSNSTRTQRKTKIEVAKKKHVHPAAIIGQYRQQEKKDQTTPGKQTTATTTIIITTTTITTTTTSTPPPSQRPIQKESLGHDDIKVTLPVLSTTMMRRPRLKSGHGLTLGKHTETVPSGESTKRKLVSKSNQDRPTGTSASGHLHGIQKHPQPTSQTVSQVPIKRISSSKQEDIFRDGPTPTSPSFNKKAGLKRKGRVRQKRLKNRKRGKSHKKSANRRKLYSDQPRPIIKAKRTPEKVKPCKLSFLTIKYPDLTTPGSHLTIPAPDITTPVSKLKASRSGYHA